MAHINGNGRGRPRNAILSPNERKEATTRAKKRALSAIEEREHLRLEIDTRLILQRMSATINTLVQGWEEVQTATGETIQQPLSRERIQALKAASDIDKTLLDRVLPPLRPVETKVDEEPLPDPATMSDKELRQSVIGYLGVKHLLEYVEVTEETMQ